jgi:hypothetical protein
MAGSGYRKDGEANADQRRNGLAGAPAAKH